MRPNLHLIIAHLDLPGMSAELMCSRIRDDAVPRSVQIIMVCANNRTAIEQASRCRPNAVILRPVNTGILLSRAQQLLAVVWRETFRISITVTVQGNEKGGTFSCRSRDISLSGMLMETEQKLEKGDCISCSFVLPDSTKIMATGEIVRAMNGRGVVMNHYGVQFVQMSAESRNALEKFINGKS